MALEVWIGLAEVRQRPGAGSMLDRNEAVTNVLALATSEEAFRTAASIALSALGFDLVTLEEAEPLDVRRQAYVVSDELLLLAAEVRDTGTARFGKFHTWVSDD